MVMSKTMVSGLNTILEVAHIICIVNTEISH